VDHDLPTGLRVGAWLALAVLAGLAAACSNSSPTEPPAQAVIVVDVGGGPSGSGGQINVRAEACSCHNASFDLVLDGASQVTIGCGEERVLVVAAGQHTLKIYSTKISGALTAMVTVTATQGAVVRLSCR
jgi:hypothetical protein